MYLNNTKNTQKPALLRTRKTLKCHCGCCTVWWPNYMDTAVPFTLPSSMWTMQRLHAATNIPDQCPAPHSLRSAPAVCQIENVRPCLWLPLGDIPNQHTHTHARKTAHVHHISVCFPLVAHIVPIFIADKCIVLAAAAAAAAPTSWCVGCSRCFFLCSPIQHLP